MEGDFIPVAAEIADPGKMQAQAAAIIIAAPQPLGRFREQVLGEIMRALVGAQVRFKDVLMADAFGKAGGGRLDIHAVQHLVEQHAVDAAPHPAQLKRRRVPQLGDGEDAGAVKPLLHARADPWISCNSRPRRMSGSLSWVMTTSPSGF